MKFFTTIVFLLFSFCVKLFAQTELNDFTTVIINKQVKDCISEFDLSTPFNSYLSYTYLSINGVKSMERASSSYRIKGFMSNPNTANILLAKEKKEILLNMVIKEIIVFKDSIAGVITNYTDSIYLIRFSLLTD